MKPYDKDKLNSFSLNIIKDLADGLSIDELLKRTYDEFHFSILLTDSTYHYISYAGSSKITDPMWKKIIDDGEPTGEVILMSTFITKRRILYFLLTLPSISIGVFVRITLRPAVQYL